MVVRFVLFILIAALSATSFPLVADQHGSVRMYKLNSKDQMVNRRWVKKSEQPGCHDLRGRKKAHRFAQVGFSWCTVYSEGDCLAGSEIKAMWHGEKYRTADIDISAPQIKLLPGSNWYLDESENILVGSWFCEY